MMNDKPLLPIEKLFEMARHWDNLARDPANAHLLPAKQRDKVLDLILKRTRHGVRMTREEALVLIRGRED